MASGLYLALMLGAMAILTAIIVPALFWKRCGRCDARNHLDARVCVRCGHPFPDARGPGSD